MPPRPTPSPEAESRPAERRDEDEEDPERRGARHRARGRADSGGMPAVRRWHEGTRSREARAVPCSARGREPAPDHARHPPTRCPGFRLPVQRDPGDRRAGAGRLRVSVGRLARAADLPRPQRAHDRDAPARPRSPGQRTAPSRGAADPRAAARRAGLRDRGLRLGLPAALRLRPRPRLLPLRRRLRFRKGRRARAQGLGHRGRGEGVARRSEGREGPVVPVGPPLRPALSLRASAGVSPSGPARGPTTARWRTRIPRSASFSARPPRRRPPRAWRL